MAPSLPPRRNARSWLIACLTAPGVVAAVADLFGWSDWVPSIAMVVAVVVASQLVLTRSVWSCASFAVKAVALAAFVAAVFWMIAMMFAPGLTVLAVRGEPVAATVVSDVVTHHSGRFGSDDEHCYSLRRADGAPIRGTVCRDQGGELTVGATVGILVDPGGLIAPETSDEVADDHFWQIFGSVGLAVTLVAGWITGGLAANIGSGRRPSRRIRGERRSGRHDAAS